MTHNESLTGKLQQIQALASACLLELQATKKAHRRTGPMEAVTSNPNLSGEASVVEIVNKIKECEEHDEIEKKVLDQRSVENRILVVLYICSKHFPVRRLSTGEISKVTSELGVKVKQPNVAKTITKSLLKYLDSDSVRTKGKASLYKLNRKGVSHFESILNG